MIALATSGAAEGTWLRAEQQHAGRGRLAREWVSLPGNLYASGLVRLRSNDPPAPTLALVTAVSLVETVKVFAPAVPVMIKWPNDVMIGGAKLAGILLERSGDAVIVGVGVNLSHHPDIADRPATSLAAYGPAPDPAAFCETLAETFARWLARWRGDGLSPIRHAWLAAAHPIGTAFSATIGDGQRVEGQFNGLTDEGALRLRLADGTNHVIHAGDVFLI